MQALGLDALALATVAGIPAPAAAAMDGPWCCNGVQESVFLGGDELVALAVDVDYLYLVVVLQVLAQFGYVHVH